MSRTQTTRPCAVCGTFYPEDPGTLREEVQAMIHRGLVPETPATPLGVIAPHAGYMYSGPTAAAAYARLAGRRFETVLVASPSHRDAFADVSVYPGAAYETPLGPVFLDTELREALIAESSVVTASLLGHRSEHAIEVQLPFLQVILGDFKLVPLVLGSQTREVCLELGELLGRVCAGRQILLVASTDLSHYFPADAADDLDGIARDDISRFDEDRLMDDLDQGRTEACGGGPMVAVMKGLRLLGATRMEIVQHCTSGDITGDRRSVVGYCSAVAWEDSPDA